VPQPPGRYLLCDPANGSLNLQDTQVAAEVAAGGTFATWIDGKDKNGNYIGLTCDPPSSYGTIKDCFGVHRASTSVHGSNSGAFKASSSLIACSRPSRSRWP
jgi:hypothetical protein